MYRPAPPMPSGHEAGSFRVLIRGITKRCPRCGERKLFVHWLKAKERCPRCLLRLERTEGAFLGSMTINYAVTMAVWLALLIVWLALTLPDVEVAPLLATSLAVVGLLPVGLYPFAKTTWSAIDFLVWRVPTRLPRAQPRARAVSFDRRGAHDRSMRPRTPPVHC